jgi:hypothetical protein
VTSLTPYPAPKSTSISFCPGRRRYSLKLQSLNPTRPTNVPRRMGPRNNGYPTGRRLMSRQFSTTIHLRGASGTVTATLNCETVYPSPSTRTCTIDLGCERGKLRGEGPDYFEAFCSIREQLEEWGFRPLCYGASRDRFPSGMARDMGEGLKVYKMRIGAQASDLAPIFDEGKDIEPATIAEQRAFFESCIGALRGHPPVG